MTTLAETYCAFCDRIALTVNNLISKWENRERPYNRDTYNALSKLSDHDLKDIGLCRGDIMFIAKGGSIYRK
jgi:uncharacterized protein YjiS (DUF1127 family)